MYKLSQIHRNQESGLQLIFLDDTVQPVMIGHWWNKEDLAWAPTASAVTIFPCSWFPLSLNFRYVKLLTYWKTYYVNCDIVNYIHFGDLVQLENFFLITPISLLLPCFLTLNPFLISSWFPIFILFFSKYFIF